MPRKGKRRREAARARREVAERAAAPTATPAPAAEGEPRPAPRRPRPAGPRGRARRAAGFRARGFLPVAAVVAVVVVGAGIAAWLVLAGGSSGNGGETDPFANITPDVTLTIEARGAEQGSWYEPATLTAKAGQTVEIVIKNTGTVSHNLHVSGADKEYDTLDDCLQCGAKRQISFPQAIEPGKEGHVIFKIDEPGTYPFKCDFHPDTQKGNLVLQ